MVKNTNQPLNFNKSRPSGSIVFFVAFFCLISCFDNDRRANNSDAGDFNAPVNNQMVYLDAEGFSDEGTYQDAVVFEEEINTKPLFIASYSIRSSLFYNMNTELQWYLHQLGGFLSRFSSCCDGDFSAESLFADDALKQNLVVVLAEDGYVYFSLRSADKPPIKLFSGITGGDWLRSDGNSLLFQEGFDLEAISKKTVNLKPKGQLRFNARFGKQYPGGLPAALKFRKIRGQFYQSGTDARLAFDSEMDVFAMLYGVEEYLIDVCPCFAEISMWDIGFNHNGVMQSIRCPDSAQRGECHHDPICSELEPLLLCYTGRSVFTRIADSDVDFDGVNDSISVSIELDLTQIPGVVSCH